MTRVAGVLAALRERLAPASPSAALDAELLVAHVAGIRRAALAGEPVAYLTGRREFWSLELEVTPDVLVPRPETELVVERALAALGDGGHPAVLDLGTGSGAIALAIAHERPNAAVTATDVSAAALAVAKRNAVRLGLRNLRFLEGPWFDPLAGGGFDVIASNPPYVAAGDPALAALAHEPRDALVAGSDGLAAIGAIASAAPARLVRGGWLIVEHGANQGAAVRALFSAAGLAAVATWPDLAGHERVTQGTRSR